VNDSGVGPRYEEWTIAGGSRMSMFMEWVLFLTGIFVVYSVFGTGTTVVI